MAVRSVTGRKSSKLDLGDMVRTSSGLVGEIIGLAEYRYGWEYRIRVRGKAKTMYRMEDKLTLVNRGLKSRKMYLSRFHGKVGDLMPQRARKQSPDVRGLRR